MNHPDWGPGRLLVLGTRRGHHGPPWATHHGPSKRVALETDRRPLGTSTDLWRYRPAGGQWVKASPRKPWKVDIPFRLNLFHVRSTRVFSALETHFLVRFHAEIGFRPRTIHQGLGAIGGLSYLSAGGTEWRRTCSARAHQGHDQKRSAVAVMGPKTLQGLQLCFFGEVPDMEFKDI